VNVPGPQKDRSNDHSKSFVGAQGHTATECCVSQSKSLYMSLTADRVDVELGLRKIKNTKSETRKFAKPTLRRSIQRSRRPIVGSVD
jgi:hypothetical protein